MLPLPTVSGLDVTAEKLSDIERRRAMKAPNIAEATTSAVNTGLAVNKAAQEQADAEITRTDAQKAREQAQWFQKEYVDKGWEGADKLWKENGSDPKLDPKHYRTAFGDAPTKYFETFGKELDRTKSEAAVKKYQDAVAAGTSTPEQLSALAIAAGNASGKGYEATKDERDRKDKQLAEENKTTRATDLITSREKIATARNATAREVANIRRDAANLKGDDKTQVDFFLESSTNYEKEIADVYGKYGTDEATRSYSLSPEDKKKIDGLARQRDDALRNANILIRKGAKPGATTLKEGDRKTNSTGDKMIVRGGVWVPE